MSASESERAMFLQKQASYGRIRAMLRPNRDVKHAPIIYHPFGTFAPYCPVVAIAPALAGAA